VLATQSVMLPAAYADGQPVLLCCPAAGGGRAAFAGWQSALADCLAVCAVTLGGREARAEDPLPKTLETAVTEIVDDVAVFLYGARYFVVYGDCAGGLLALQLARRLRALQQLPRVAALIVTDPPPVRKRPRFSALGPEQALALVKAMAAPGPQSSSRDALHAAVARAYRHDVNMYSNAPCNSTQPLGSDIWVFQSSSTADDSIVAEWARLAPTPEKFHVQSIDHRDTPVHAVGRIVRSQYDGRSRRR